METTQPDRTASPFVEPWQPTQRAVILTIAAVTLLVLLSATTFAVQRVFYTPEAALERYFDALADRDAGKAEALLSDDSSSTAAGILTAATYQPPTGLKVESVKDDEDDEKSRTAKISYVLGGQTVSGTVSLRRSEKLSAGLFRGWSISESRPSLQITSSTPVAVQVNGVTLPAESEQSPRTTVFPGRYVVAVADNLLLDSDPVTVDVGFGDAEANLVTKIKETARAEVDKQIKEYLKGCLVAATKPESNCPFSIGYGTVTNPVWRIDKYPTIELRLNSSGGLVVDTTADGRATLTGKGYGGAPYADSTPFDVDGGAAVEQDKVVFLPN